MVKSLKFRSVRFDVYWGLLEPERGRYDWTLTDQLVNSVGEGTEIVFTLYSTSEWGSMYNDCRELARERRGINVFNKPPSSIPLEMADYTDFLQKITSRYKNRVKYWQVENEVYGSVFRNIPRCQHANRFWVGTMEEYLDLLKASYVTIKGVDPTAKVFASSFTFEPWPLKRENPFLLYVLDQGRNYTDLIDVHLYLGVNEDPEKIAWLLEKLRDLGYKKPIWATETGEIDIEYYGPSFAGTLSSQSELRLQAQETVKRYVLAFASGVDRVFQLRLNPYGAQERADSRWAHMGLTYDESGLKKKPSYYAMEVIIQKLEGFTEIRRLSSTRYQFTVKGRPVFVLWSAQQKEIFDMSGLVQSEKVRVTETVALGAPPSTAIVPASGVVLTPDPVIVEAS
jgi:GH35 family endo-1,4-beta-xylanase